LADVIRSLGLLPLVAILIAVTIAIVVISIWRDRAEQKKRNGDKK